MVEETQAKATEASPASEVKAGQETPPPVPAPVAEFEKKTQIQVPQAVEDVEHPPPTAEASVPISDSFKEESNLVSDLPELEKKSLDELKQLIQAALDNHEFDPPTPSAAPKAEEHKSEKAKSHEPNPEEHFPVEPKTEEPAAVVETEAPKFEEPAPVAEIEAPKAEVPDPGPPEEPKEEEIAAPVAQKAEDSAVVNVVEAVVDEDGAKTVKAIEETVVSVTLPAATTAEEVALTEEQEKGKDPIAEVEATATEQPPEEEFIWGVPLLGDEKSDTVLLKFLRARDFKVKDALAMLKNAVIWRKQFGIENLLEEDLAVPELEKVVFYHGQDKEGHPVCYNVYGKFQDQELYGKAFGDDEKREKFLRWRIQSLEKGIRQQLDFSPQGVCTMVQVTDLTNVPGPGKKELRQATKKALALLQDNYPEFVAKQVFINVPWWYLAYYRILSPFFSMRTRSKFVFAGPSRSAETLFRYIAPEQVPVQYGGLNKDNDPDFTTSDAVSEVIIKPSGKHMIELPATEPILFVWEIRVLGWDVTYSAEFVPNAEEAYTVLVQKARKFTASDEPYLKNSYKVGEPGKIILTIDNATTKKKKLLYRSKSKTTSEST